MGYLGSSKTPINTNNCKAADESISIRYKQQLQSISILQCGSSSNYSKHETTIYAHPKQRKSARKKRLDSRQIQYLK